jgi:hypothetical protein
MIAHRTPRTVRSHAVIAAVDVRWWIFLHVAGVLVFVMAHGVSIAVALRLRRERDRARIAALLQFSGASVLWMYVSLLWLVVAGVITAFAISAWGKWWLWVSIGLLLVVIAEMNVVAKPYYQRVKEAVEVRPSGVPRRSDQELDEILRSPTALVNTTIGFGALVVILWLMIFNPGV